MGALITMFITNWISGKKTKVRRSSSLPCCTPHMQHRQLKGRHNKNMMCDILSVEHYTRWFLIHSQSRPSASNWKKTLAESRYQLMFFSWYHTQAASFPTKACHSLMQNCVTSYLINLLAMCSLNTKNDSLCMLANSATIASWACCHQQASI